MLTAAVAGATGGIWGSYQVPASTVNTQGRRLVVRGVRIDAVNIGAAVATTATTVQFSLAYGHTAVSLATAEAAAAKVLQASHIGDQNFIAALGGPDCFALRIALVQLADAFREELDDE